MATLAFHDLKAAPIQRFLLLYYLLPLINHLTTSDWPLEALYHP